MQHARFRFAHRLTADAAYAALLGSNRRLLHSAAADALLARHQPGVPGERELLLDLADQLEAAGRADEAHERLCALLSLLADTGMLEGWNALARRAAASWERLRESDPALPEQSAGLVFAHASRARLSGELDEAFALMQVLLAQSTAARDAFYTASAHSGLAAVLQSRGQLDEALAELARCTAIARELGNAGLLSRALNQQGITLHSLGRHDEALAALSDAFEIATRTGNLRRVGIAGGNLGVVYAMLGERDKAQQFYQVELDKAREIGDLRGESYALSHLGNLHLKEGQLEAARRSFSADLAISTLLDDSVSVGIAHGTLAMVSEAEGDHVRAAELYALAIDAALEVGDSRFSGQWFLRRAGLHLKLGALGQARTDLLAAQPQLLRTGDPNLLANCYCSLARLELAEGNLPAARGALDDARAALGPLEDSGVEVQREIAEMEADLAAR